MPAVTTKHAESALRAALQAVGAVEALVAGTSSAAVGAMDWARWEYTIDCGRRRDQWNAAKGRKVKGSHVVIYDTRPERAQRLTALWEYGGPVLLDDKYGRFTATEIYAQQQSMVPFITAMHEKLDKELNRQMSHQLDAIAYVAMGYGHAYAELGRGFNPYDRMITADPQRHERARAWQQNLIDTGPLLSATLLSAPRTSRSEGNKSKRGWLSRMRRKSTA